MEDINFKIKRSIPNSTGGTINIIDTYSVKQTFRALMLFEEMTDTQYENDGKMNTQFKMLYCILKAANRQIFKYTYDEFIDLLDDNQDSVQEFFNYINSLIKPDKKKAKASV